MFVNKSTEGLDKCPYMI